jgi:hypothetical protein
VCLRYGFTKINTEKTRKDELADDFVPNPGSPLIRAEQVN